MKDSAARTLAVILHADVVGSTALVQRDEALAHRRIQGAFERLSAHVRSYHGVTHERRGDALVAEFARASDAVGAALLFQRDNVRANAEIDDGLTAAVRIGICLGEVVFADGTVSGAGVVLAQRVEQMCSTDGVAVTAAIREAAPAYLPVDYVDRGERSAKGFGDSVHVYAVRLQEGAEIAPGPRPGRQLTEPAARRRRAGVLIGLSVVVSGMLAWWLLSGDPRSGGDSTPATAALDAAPAIAVLPFANVSSDPEQVYFSDGVTEDIIARLARLPALSVISRTSSFRFKDTAAPTQEIARELGVEYLLEGTVRRSGRQIRVTAQLVAAGSGHQLWSQQYDREVVDVFAVQDDIADRIVQALAVEVPAGDSAGRRAASHDFEAYDAFLQGRRHFSAQSIEGFRRARLAYRRAIELDPGYARAYGALATTLVRLVQAGAVDAPLETSERALVLAERAVALDAESPQTHWALGFVRLHRGEMEAALEAAQHSVSKAPSFAEGHLLLGLINNNLLRADRALKYTRRAMQLNPGYSWDYPYNLGRAYYTLGDYQQAVNVLVDALERNEENYIPRLWLAASYMQLGQAEDAEWEVEQIEMLVPSIGLSTLPAARRDPKLHGDLLRAGLRE